MGHLGLHPTGRDCPDLRAKINFVPRHGASLARSRSGQDDKLKKGTGHIGSTGVDDLFHERGDVLPRHGWLMLRPLSFAWLLRQQMVNNVKRITLDQSP